MTCAKALGSSISSALPVAQGDILALGDFAQLRLAKAAWCSGLLEAIASVIQFPFFWPGQTGHEKTLKILKHGTDSKMACVRCIQDSVFRRWPSSVSRYLQCCKQASEEGAKLAHFTPPSLIFQSSKRSVPQMITTLWLPSSVMALILGRSWQKDLSLPCRQRWQAQEIHDTMSWRCHEVPLANGGSLGDFLVCRGVSLRCGVSPDV